jgi:hypothetical protein
MRLALLLAVLITACTSAVQEPSRAPAPPPEPPAPTIEPTEVATVDSEADEDIDVPTTCSSEGGDVCTPTSAFVEKLCRKRQPNVALTLFRKGSPWTRTYVRVRNMEAWLVGGRRTSPAKLKLFEEVIIVHDRSASEGGIKVSGAGSFDVLRWDGTCVSVMSDEVATRRPGSPEVATIQWKRLDAGVRKVLKEDSRIAYRDEQRKEHCKGAKSAHRCEAARDRLSEMVASYIRAGGSVPSATALE